MGRGAGSRLAVYGETARCPRRDVVSVDWVESRPTVDDVRSAYGIAIEEMVSQGAGWEGRYWVADGTWFVKAWHRAPPVNLELLARLTAEGLPVPAPIPTLDGSLVAEAAGVSYALFPFVRGREGTDEGDWEETARWMRRLHEVRNVDLPRTTMDEAFIFEHLSAQLGHPWIRDHADELRVALDRLEAVIHRARAVDVPLVVCHNDFGAHNLLVDDTGEVVAILDWDHACLGPREHDLWIAPETRHGREFLLTYGATNLEMVHVEYALLARALRDLTARVVNEQDRTGVHTWGFARLARLPADLELFDAFARH